MLTTAGLQLPLTPFVLVEGSVGTEPPEQIVSEEPKLNAGVVLGVTVMVLTVGIAH